MKTFQALSALLTYPTADLVAAVPELEDVIVSEGILPGKVHRALGRLLRELQGDDLLEVQERYVSLFDRCPSLSLHLFQHVHGDSRDRGQAMVELGQLYAQNGLDITVHELPDFLPLYLEFLGLCPPADARRMLGDVGHILALLYARLAQRGSPYADVIAALLAIAGIKPQVEAKEVEADDSPEALDRAWEDREVRFTGDDAAAGSGCSKAAEMVRRMDAIPAGGAR